MRNRAILVLALISLWPSVNGLALAQFKEYAPMRRLRPADVHLENVTIAVQVEVVDYGASHLENRLWHILTAELHRANPTLRKVGESPEVLLICSLNQLDFRESWETSTYRVKAKLEVTYQVVGARDNHVYASGTVSPEYSASFSEGKGAPARSEVENSLLQRAVSRIIRTLANTEEYFQVRLMRKDELEQCARLAQTSPQWLQYIECINALPEKPDIPKHREYNGDRQYDIGIAYEALAYEAMWKDYDRADKYFELAERYFREAQRFDPKEKEYGRAFARMSEGRQYFEIIKARFPKKSEVMVGAEGKGIGEIVPSDTMTNEKVIEMVKEGLPEDVILTAIRQSPRKKFDVSPDALIELRRRQRAHQVLGPNQCSLRLLLIVVHQLDNLFGPIGVSQDIPKDRIAFVSLSDEPFGRDLQCLCQHPKFIPSDDFGRRLPGILLAVHQDFGNAVAGEC
jgi:hypothetical protein